MFSVKFQLPEVTPVWLSISDMNGKIIDREALKNLVPGENMVTRELKRALAGKACIVTLETEVEQAAVKVVIQE